MLPNKPHVAIILLNWNGWEDTIECLESILKLTYENFNVILIDNDSSDVSLQRIEQWAEGHICPVQNTKYPEIVLPEVDKPVHLYDYYDMDLTNSNIATIENRSILLVKNKENLGFALANNQGMEIADGVFESQYYFLLNNDTVIEKSAVTDLVTIMTKNNNIQVSQSTIYSYNDNKIVNAGGKIFFWAQTKHFKTIRDNEIRRISFVNGCALFVRASLIDKLGKLSDKFFHGEEDFEFSMRMNKNHVQMICSGGSSVYHKVGSSVNKLMRNYERRTFLFALNRTVDLKDYYPKSVWYIWRFITLNYFIYLLWIKYGVSFKRTLFLINKLYKYSGKLNEVQRKTVEKIYTELNLL